MSILSWLFGNKKAKDKSFPKKPYKVHKYHITKHCVEDMNSRKITKGEVHVNLTTKPIEVTKAKIDNFGRPSYRRSSKNKITTAINPTNNNVTSVNRLHTKTYNKIMRGKNDKHIKK